MAIIRNFRATTYNRAFILNALATTITVIVALFVREAFERAQHGDQNGSEPLNAGLVVATIGATFVSALVAYYSLHWIFGFGAGMLVSDVEVHFTKDEQHSLVQQFHKGKGNAVIQMRQQNTTPSATHPSDHIQLRPFPQNISLQKKAL